MICSVILKVFFSGAFCFFLGGLARTHAWTCWMLIGWLDVFRSVSLYFFVYTLNYHRFYTSTQKHIYTEFANL